MPHLTKFLSTLPIMMLLHTFLCSEGMSQDYQPVTFPSIGTLNLVLANKKGFVIAADSRQTNRSSGAYSDDSQKLFRIGPMSAMVIAGFASSLGLGSLLDIQVAAVLREEFLDDNWASGKRSISDLPGFINVGIGYQLSLLGALFASSKPVQSASSLDFKFIAAEITTLGKVQIVQEISKPRIEYLGPTDLEIPSYELDSSVMIADHFVAMSAGQDQVARTILDGTIQTADTRILDYYRSRAARQLDEFSLVALENLAVAILEVTSRATVLVGGPHQIGVFAKDGTIKWTLAPLATDRQTLHSTILKIGIPYTPDSLTPQEYRAARGKKFVTNMNLSLYQPFEQPLIQVFIGSWFRDVTVSLDGNVFAGNQFNHVRFKYKGGQFEWFDNNGLSDCVVETPTEVELPAQLVSCKLEQKTSVDDAGAFGSPVRAQPTGCVKQNAEGKLVLKTDGWDNGKNCKDSGLTVPRIFP